MDANLQKILSEALELSDDQKVELASELYESIERPFRKEVEESWAREIERRLAAMESGEVKGIPGRKFVAGYSESQMTRRRLEFHPLAEFELTEAHMSGMTNGERI